MHAVYIIYSAEFDKYYVGETENFSERLSQHNTGFFAQSSTGFTDDWEMKKIIQVENRVQARIIERYIKSMKSKVFLEKLITDADFYEEFKVIMRARFSISIRD